MHFLFCFDLIKCTMPLMLKTLTKDKKMKGFRI